MWNERQFHLLMLQPKRSDILKQQLHLENPSFLSSKGGISILNNYCPTSGSTVVFCFCINGLFFPP